MCLTDVVVGSNRKDIVMLVVLDTTFQCEYKYSRHLNNNHVCLSMVSKHVCCLFSSLRVFLMFKSLEAIA